MVRRVISALVISCSALTLTGCKEILEQITGLISSEQPSEDEIFKRKIKSDLNNFDQIRTFQNTTFFELKDALSKAADKKLSTTQIRAELLGFSNALQNQNEQLKQQHFQTPEVAKMRNSIMELHYITITLIAVVDNPNVVKARLSHYLNQQKDLINEYNKLRLEAESLL